MGRTEEVVFGIELGEFPRGTRAIAMLFGKAIVLVQTMLSLDFAHAGIQSEFRGIRRRRRCRVLGLERKIKERFLGFYCSSE